MDRVCRDRGGDKQGVREARRTKWTAQNIWADRLFLYLLMHEEKVTDELGGFCKTFGIGLLRINPAKIITEIVTPENQHGLIAREMKLTCPKCFKDFTPGEEYCSNCGSSLEPGISWRFADTFGGPGAKKTRVGRPGCITPNMPYRVTPVLRKVFQDRRVVTCLRNLGSV